MVDLYLSQVEKTAAVTDTTNLNFFCYRQNFKFISFIAYTYNNYNLYHHKIFVRYMPWLYP